MWKEISKFGKKLVFSGLVSSHFGNISLRIGNQMLITRSGSMLDEIDENGVVNIQLDKESSFDLIASSESIVHREIYKRTSALAIIHAHCEFATILSLTRDKIIPVDSEGKYFLHEIMVVNGGIGTRELSENCATVLREHKGVIAKGHGTFATGKILDEAYINTCILEHSCKMLYFYEALKPHCNKDI